MKKLNEVTQEDAIAILGVEYAFFHTGRWILTDETKEMGEPCKKFKCTNKTFLFWFNDDEITIDRNEDNAPLRLDDFHFDVKFACYLKAAEFGYYVPGLNDTIYKMMPTEAQINSAKSLYVVENHQEHHGFVQGINYIKEFFKNVK